MRIGKLLNLKTLLFVFTLSVIANNAAAQNNVGIFFQAVARDNFSNPAKSRKIYVQSSVIQTSATGTKVLIEEHQTSTDATGMFSISVGNGTRIGGAASGLLAIDWSNGPFFLNLKIAISPVAGSAGWDYTKEFVDMGTTSFGAVPYALYAANAAGVNQKLNIADTAKMLSPYAKSVSVQNLSGVVDTKLAIKDTLAMLAPYARVSAVLDSGYINAQLKSKVSLADSGLKYVTPTDMAILSNRVSANVAAISAEESRATAAELALSNRVTSNTVSITANTNDIASTNINVASNTASIAANTTAITTEVARATAAELALSNRIASNTASITANTAAIAAEVTRATAAELALTNNGVSSNTASITANTAAIAAEVTRATAAELALTNSVAANTASITANTNSIATQASALNLKADATDVTTALNLKANITDVTSALNLKANAADLTTGLALKVNASQLGIPNGIATLNSSGIIPSSQLPPVNLSSTNVVSSDADMTALSSATVGSIAIRTDLNKNYVLSALPASTLGNWVELLTPAAPVQTVNGYTGAINLSKADINLGNVDNTSDATKPVSTATQAALDLKLDANKVGVATGVASLNALGKIPTDQIPAISFSSVKVLGSQADMLALSSAVVGSVVIRTDVNKNYVLAAIPATTLAVSYTHLTLPTILRV